MAAVDQHIEYKRELYAGVGVHLDGAQPRASRRRYRQRFTVPRIRSADFANRGRKPVSSSGFDDNQFLSRVRKVGSSALGAELQEWRFAFAANEHWREH